MTRRHCARAVALLLLAAPLSCTQTLQAQAADTVNLDALQQAAQRTDRRAAQLDVIARQAALRLRNIRSELRPSLSATATVQYLSDVPSIGTVQPGGASIPSPANDQYDSYLSVRQALFDPTRARRAAVEEAQQADASARVATTVWQQRLLVNEAFFAVLLRDAQRRTLDAVITDLEARRVLAVRRVSGGTALPSEALLVDAELVRRKQGRGTLMAERAAALEVLEALTDVRMPATVVLQVRGIAVSAAGADSVATLTDASMLRARPEFVQFERSRALVEARRAALMAQDRPRVSLVARTGYGRPGLNQLGRRPDTYATAGVQVEWNLWSWRRTTHESQAQVMQQEMLVSDEGAFAESLRRALITERGRITALEQTLESDDTVVALRTRILAETRLRHDEGEVTSADYISRLTEQLVAELDRDEHRVRLLESRARYLTTLGREVR